MNTRRLTRKTRFRIALVAAESSISEWAKQNRVSRTHLYAVLDGNRIPSAELQAKIDAVLATANVAA